ncbi:hypothetical protein ABPG72_010673 [Tetrahymena utriculariae]
MSEDSQYSDIPGGWISWFCALEDHQFLCEVDDDYIRDNFNLYGIKQKFNHYNDTIEMILSSESPDDDDLEDERFLEIYQEATDVYGLIHARFITSPKGLALMREKFLLGRFGVCPRVLCERQNVLPVGMSEELRTSRVKVYCPRCEDVYIPKKKCPDIDGCYFGVSFPQILLMTYPDLVPSRNQSTYIPRIYGFRIYKKKGSKFLDEENPLVEITHYSEELLRQIRGKVDKKNEEKKALTNSTTAQSYGNTQNNNNNQMNN